MKSVLWEDIFYFCQYSSRDYAMDFKLYSCGIDSQGNPVILENGGSIELEKATPIVEGSIKWDGCSNFVHPQEKEVMSHYCGLNNHRSYFSAWERIYELAAGTIARGDRSMILGKLL